jgi:carbamoyltransferase
MPCPPAILGISAFFHDSAAALIRGSEIVAAAQEERFSRRKNDERFPSEAVRFCLRHAGIELADLAAVVFYEKPIKKFTRVLESYLAVAPGGWKTFPRVLPSWLAEKLEMRGSLRRELPGLPHKCELLFTEHHQAHAASAFFPSPFTEAAVLSVDGVGEWATTAIGHGHGHELTLHQELRFPHSRRTADFGSIPANIS